MNNNDDFLKTNFSYAIVTRASIDEIQKLKEFLKKNNLTICYQKTSTNRLWIKEGDAQNDR